MASHLAPVEPKDQEELLVESVKMDTKQHF